MRTFFAIKPPAPILAAMTEAATPLQQAITSCVKWVPADQIHLTVKFLGNLSPEHVDPLREKLVAACAQVGLIQTATTAIGVFPPRGDARVIWFGIEASNELNLLARMIEDACAELGYAREKRPFSPHFTIGRVRRNAGRSETTAIRHALDTHSGSGHHPFSIHRLYLIQSTLSPAGPQYRDVFTIAV
jgi:RNA 2',3'-cyclic 3'-phosphodiesterase